MSVSKLNFYENFMGCCVRSPTSLKEHTITKIAIQLCQNMAVKQYIICECEEPGEYRQTEVDVLMINKSADICSKLSLPLALENLLIVRFQSLALQLFIWSRQQAMFDFFPSFADIPLTPSDWTVEGRLDERKIAERLVQDERIPICQRYKMACLYCLETIIYSLWHQISIPCRKDLCASPESELVRMWSDEMAVEGNELFRRFFLWHLFVHGSKIGSRSTVFYCWDKARISETPSLLTHSSSCIREEIFRGFYQSSSPYIDILCFLLTEMSTEKRVEFFEKAFLNDHYNILLYFLKWPYLDLLLPIIRELWSILPMVKYGGLLLYLARIYSDEFDCRRLGYEDYNYGGFMIDLLEETPDHFKRYIFSDSGRTDKNPIEILCFLIKKRTLNYRNIKIFQRIWQHVSLKERRSFLKSRYGESFLPCLVFKNNCEQIFLVLKESLPEDDVILYNNLIALQNSFLRLE